MARDKTLAERMESVLHSCAVPHSGKIAAVVVEQVAEENENARCELTLAIGLIASGTDPERTRKALVRVRYALDAIGGPLNRKG